MEGKGDIFECAVRAESFDAQQLAFLCLAFLGVHFTDFPSHHHADDIVHVGLAGRLCGNEFSITEDGDGVGDTKDLFEFVGDVDDAHAVAGEVAKDAE